MVKVSYVKIDTANCKKARCVAYVDRAKAIGEARSGNSLWIERPGRICCRRGEHRLPGYHRSISLPSCLRSLNPTVLGDGDRKDGYSGDCSFDA
jgi:hypothetical protein